MTRTARLTTCSLSSAASVMLAACVVVNSSTAWTLADMPMTATHSVPVKVLPAESTTAAQDPTSPADTNDVRPGPTLPSGKFPQYQFTPGAFETLGDAPNESPLKLLLSFPDHALLIHAEITIDGQPFSQAREARIQQIQSAIAELATETAAPPADSAPLPQPESDGTEPQAPTDDVTATAYQLANFAEQYIERYARATGRALEAGEIRWLLATRVDGPVLLPLRENFQRFRADQRPAFRILDLNRDQVLSADEIEQAATTFEACDRNRDDIVEFREIAEAARYVSNEPYPPLAISLIHVNETTAPISSAQLGSALARIDTDSNGQVAANELERLRTAAPDVKLVINFDTADAGQSTIRVTAPSERFVAAAVDAVSLSMGDAEVSFSAVQAGASDQISLGAVVDGYPLLPVLDLNSDGRFTRRERRELAMRLQQFDDNQDGAISIDEVGPTIRLCVGLGAVVHRELATIRRVHPPSLNEDVEGPPWFARMDRNQDGDLTRREFPGTDEQFNKLDADQDGLVSAQEALSLQDDSPTAP